MTQGIFVTGTDTERGIRSILRAPATGRDSLTWPRADALKWLRRGGGGVLV